MDYWVIKNNRNGFTLIELLVIISIVGLLSSMAFYAFNLTRVKARDVKRKADLRQIHTALEVFYDNNNSYIDTGEICGDYSTGCSSCGCGGETAHAYGHWSPSFSNIYRALSPDYISVVPEDPINNSSYFYYFEPNCGSQGNCNGASTAICCEYTLCAQRLETTGSKWCNDSFGMGQR